MADVYTYSVLGKGYTRILHLQASLSEGLLWGSLEDTTLADAKNTFVALSWTWGKQAGNEKPRQMKMDGKLLAIRPNLWNMLNTFRNHGRTLHLWVDAICINQDKSNPQDKNTHIPMLADIYQAASEVWIWLGPSANDSDYVMEALRSQNEEAYTSSRFVAGLLEILQRPWWTRTWIVQEYILHPKSPKAFCGEVPGISTDAMLKIWTRETTRNMVPKVCLDWPKLERLGTIYWLHRLRGSRDNPRGLHKRYLRNALTWLKGFEVTEPRDKIYGALGLIEAESREHFVEVVGVHTEKTAAQVYWDATIYLLGHTKSSDIYCDFPAGRLIGQDVPSWVPDFNLDITSAVESAVRLAKVTSNHPDVLNEAIMISKDCRKLSTRGLFLGRVTKRIVVNNETMLGLGGNDEMDIYLRWPHLLHRFQDLLLGNKSITPLDLPEPLWKTLIAGNYGSLPDEEVRDTIGCQKRFDETMAIPLCDPLKLDQIPSFVEWLQQLESFTPEDLSFCNYVAELEPILSQKPHILAKIRRTLTTGRNFFVGDGGYYGVSESGTREGDLIVLLFSDRFIPFILRERGEFFEIVGVAYLPGPMKDLAIAKFQQDRKLLKNCGIV